MSDRSSTFFGVASCFMIVGGSLPLRGYIPVVQTCHGTSAQQDEYTPLPPLRGGSPRNASVTGMIRKFFQIGVYTLFCFAALALFTAGSVWAQTSQEYLEKGNSLYNSKKYDEAVASYVKAIQLEPRTQLKAYLNCARAYSMLKDYLNSQRYYNYYFEVSGDQSDKKVNAEYKAVTRKLSKEATYVRPEDQARVLVQLQSTMMSGPFINRQGGGAFAYYDILMRTGFSEPMVATLQKNLVDGLMREIVVDMTPVEGQPLPNLDRIGWEYERMKLQRATQFANVAVDKARVERINHTALGWEAYLRSEYNKAAEHFNQACDEAYPLPAAYWGRMMTAFHTDADADILRYIDQTESIYKKAELGDYTPYFALLRAQVYRSQGNNEAMLQQLDVMGAAL